MFWAGKALGCRQKQVGMYLQTKWVHPFLLCRKARSASQVYMPAQPISACFQPKSRPTTERAPILPFLLVHTFTRLLLHGSMASKSGVELNGARLQHHELCPTESPHHEWPEIAQQGTSTPFALCCW